MSQSNSSKNRLPIVLVILAFTGLSTWLLWPKGQTASGQFPAQQQPAIASNTASDLAPAGAITSDISENTKSVFSCMIEPEQAVEIRSSITGVVDKITVGRGDTVKKGQILVILNATVSQAAATSARQRAKAHAQINGARQKLALANVKAERMEQMYRQEFVSAQARDDAFNERNIAEAELKQAQENQRIAEADYRTSLAELKERTITSPFDGIVTARYADIGTVVSAADSKNPILRLVQIDRLKLTAILPFKYFQDIQTGDTVNVVPESPFNQPISITIAKKDQVVDAASGTFGIVAYIDNTQHKLPGGILCQIDI
jgi:efflux transporter, RND family, MFP subunit